MNLPPLPETDLYLCFYDEGGMQEASAGVGYTDSQMRAYAAEAVRVALEEAASIPEAAAAALLAPKRAPQVDRHCAYVLEAQASQIRALIPKD